MHPVASRMAFLAGGPLSIVLSLWSRVTLATARLEVTGPGLDGQAIFVHWHGYLPLVMPLYDGAERPAQRFAPPPKRSNPREPQE